MPHLYTQKAQQTVSTATQGVSENQLRHVGPGEGDALPPSGPAPSAVGAWSSGTLFPAYACAVFGSRGLGCQYPDAPGWPRPHALRGARIAVVCSLYSFHTVCTRQTRERTRTILPEARLAASRSGRARAVAQPSLLYVTALLVLLGVRFGPAPRPWSQGAADYGSRQASRWPLRPWRRGLWAVSASGFGAARHS